MNPRRIVLCTIMTLTAASAICQPLLLAPAGAQESDNLEVRAAFHFHFERTVPGFPPRMTVYRTSKPSISEEHVRPLLALLNINSEIRNIEDMLFADDGTRVLHASKLPHTGYLRYADDDKLSRKTKAQGLPSEDEAIARATRILVEHGLMPDATITPRTDYLRYGVIDSEGRWLEHGENALAVGFTFRVDGYRFVGPGAKAGVVFGENGEIIALSRIWRDIEADRKVPIISVRDAVDRFKKRWPPEDDHAARRRPDILTTVRIEEVFPAYFAKPGTIEQQFLEPVYVFNGKYSVRGQAGDETIEDNDSFRIVIPAMGNREGGDAEQPD